MRQSNKMKRAAAVLTALALTACASTTKPSATPIKTVERPVMPPVPAVLWEVPVRPAPPASGSPADLLEHGVRFGAYVKTLELLNQGWREWAGDHQEAAK